MTTQNYIIKFFAIAVIVQANVWSASNIEGQEGAHRVSSSKGLKTKELSFSLGGELSWGTDIVSAPVVHSLPQDQTKSSTVEELYYKTTNFAIALGLDNDWDAGAILPIHSDYVTFGGAQNSNLSEASNIGVGDIQFWSRHRLPFTQVTSSFQWSGVLTGSMNTGSEINGFLPKKLHMIPASNQQKTAPNSASISTLGAGLGFSWFNGFQNEDLSFHVNTGLRSATGLSMSLVYLWGIALEYQQNDLWGYFLEYAGETRHEMGLFDDLNYITPGVRWSFYPNWSMSLGADWNPTWDNQERSFILDKDLVDNTKSKVKTYASNPWGISWTISYTLNRINDTDKDGVLDPQDKCPGTPIAYQVDKVGCPQDIDKDGVIDPFDQCPETALGYPIDVKGCVLDTDKDLVIDPIDQCPKTVLGHPVDVKGCVLDTDKDGVIDPLDQCPKTALGHPVDVKGCVLDTDKDGVIDPFDQCPQTALGHPIDVKGCVLDTDKDGVVDPIDMCPGTPLGTAVDSKGCRFEIVIILTDLKEYVNFEIGSAVLTQASYLTLDTVAQILEKVQNVNVEVEGHTDSRGDYKFNVELSDKRAKAVKTYLIERGVHFNRLTHKGYGPDQQIKSNKSARGRRANRRVEFKVKVQAISQDNKVKAAPTKLETKAALEKVEDKAVAKRVEVKAVPKKVEVKVTPKKLEIKKGE